ncbi:NAD(P)/FAD-dependent oxidoreductase [Vannielia litorea]|uniref:NAD(P)/FAD-dependent oxidoreductase n=1 Tax=Vannielia litorea TaxID=1217970 RepID=UPI001C95F4FC|nr:FAD-binding oxidoreductase [Vannielia litorea]MBY6048665.1 FAD-binding oxidoreductase [Vannielia litorea]MBY6076079.1 FAD-binding oxidoreductase [Vannielia litorea]
MSMADITVRGAGVFGLSVAWACLRRGAKVRVIDTRGVGAGSSGGVVGALAPHVPENWNPKKAFQLESLLAAEAFWEGVKTTGGVDPGYARSGRVQPVVPGGEALARAREAGAAELWQGRASWQVVDHAPAFAPLSKTGLWVHDTLTARLHPARACAALAAAITAAGGEVLMGEVEEQGRVVWATGAEGLAALSADLGKTVGAPIKGQAALLHFSAPEAAQLFADGLHVVPHADGTVAIGSTSEREFDGLETDTQLDALIEKAATLVPLLHGAPVVKRWAGLRPRARSRAPMLGAWPGRDGHYIANGGFKIGFGMAPGVARVMADLVLDDRDSIPQGFRVEDSL